jgi:hypothetical protein
MVIKGNGEYMKVFGRSENTKDYSSGGIVRLHESVKNEEKHAKALEGYDYLMTHDNLIFVTTLRVFLSDFVHYGMSEDVADMGYEVGLGSL